MFEVDTLNNCTEHRVDTITALFNAASDHAVV
jgi:hypothetical protein